MDPGASVGGAQSAIIRADGTDTDIDPRYPAVVMVSVPNDDPTLFGLCSGTLISPSHVLTATHCVTVWNRRSRIKILFGAHPQNFGSGGGPTARPVAIRRAVACHMHPDAAALLGIDAEDCGGIGALPGAMLQSITPWDLAVLELDEPVPLGWAATAFATDYHRLLEPDELPVRGDRVTLVGYGATAAVGPADPAEFGFRRWALTFILYTSFAGEPHFVTAIGEPHAFVGDSGGPVLWPGGAGVPNRLDPVIATSAFGVGGVTAPHADDGLSSASLVDPDNIAWVNSQLDLDGDGRFDASCGGLPGRGSEFTADPLNDRDGDGVFNADDDCPNAWDPCQRDDDGDGFGNACDSCRFVANAGARQFLDSDGDGHADACDNCPLTPNPDQADHDITGDGSMPEMDGVGNACDNCPNAINADQTANCNLDAELQQGLIDLPNGLAGAGDVCDPIPCPNTSLESETGVSSPGGLPSGTTAQDLLRVDALSTNPQQARTGFRFCPCSVAVNDDDPEARRACRFDLGDGTGGCAQGRAGDGLYRRTEEQQSWRLMTLLDATPAFATTGAGLREEVTLDYAPPSGSFDTDFTSRWAQLTDESRWESKPWGWHWPRNPATSLRENLPGVLWSHASGPPAAPDFALSERLLTSHYLSGPVAPPRVARAPFECHQFLAPFVGRPSFCPLCGSSFPLPFVGLPGRFSGGLCNLEPLPPVIVLPFDELPGDQGFGPDPGPLLDVAGTWVPAAESDPWLPLGGPRYAALSSDGASLLRVLVQTPSGFAEPIQGPPNTCDNPNGCQGPFFDIASPVPLPSPGAGSASSTRASPTGLAPPCVGAGLALSSREHTLYRVGGQDAAGQPIGELWAFDTQNSLARQLPVFGQAPGEVLATTYDAATRRLFWLDVIDEPLPIRPHWRHRRRRGRRHRPAPRIRTRRMVRLVATGPFGGELTELARWPRLSRNTRFAMATDPQGRLFVAASRARGGLHLVLRLEVGNAGVRLDGFALGRGALVSDQVRASERGLSLAVRFGRHEQLIGYATEDLWGPFFGGGVFRACF